MRDVVEALEVFVFEVEVGGLNVVFVGAIAKGHCAQTDFGDFEPTAPHLAIFHGLFPIWQGAKCKALSCLNALRHALRGLRLLLNLKINLTFQK